MVKTYSSFDFDKRGTNFISTLEQNISNTILTLCINETTGIAYKNRTTDDTNC